MPISTLASISADNDEIFLLEEKVAKSYSGKFCNAIGIGLSKESAIKLAIGENRSPKYNPSLWIELAFSGEKKLDQIDNKRLAGRVSENIVNSCGSAIGLSGQKDTSDFTAYFLSIQYELKELKDD